MQYSINIPCDAVFWPYRGFCGYGDILMGEWDWGGIWANEGVVRWMLDIQLGRRNLSPIQRIAITEKYRPIYEKQARENQSKAGGDKKSLSQNSSKAVDPENKIDVRAKLAATEDQVENLTTWKMNH